MMSSDSSQTNILTTSAGIAFFRSKHVESLCSQDFKILIKWTCYYLAGLLLPAIVMTFVSGDETKALTVWTFFTSIASYVFIILLVNLTYLLFVDIAFDIRFKKRQTRRTILTFCSAMNFFNLINASLRALVFYLIIKHSYDYFFTKIATLVYILFVFLYWWQWLAESCIFSRIYSINLLLAMPAVVFLRLLSFTIMIIIGSKLWVGIFQNLGLPI